MYSIITAVGADRIREWHEQAATDQLVIEARRASREAAQAGPRRQARAARVGGSRCWTRRRAAAGPAQRVPADATPDQWASALSTAGAAERAGAKPREPVGGRAS
jgi:hypothetical protein